MHRDVSSDAAVAKLTEKLLSYTPKKDSALPKNLEFHEVDGSLVPYLCIYASEGNLGICKLLIEKGASLNAVDEHGNSALHNAVIAGDEKIVEYLITAGAMLNLENLQGQPPLIFAVCERNTTIALSLIRAGARPDWINKKSFLTFDSVMTFAAGAGLLEVVNELIEKLYITHAIRTQEHVIDLIQLSLKEALRSNNYAVAALLIEKGASFEAILYKFHSETGKRLLEAIFTTEIDRTMLEFCGMGNVAGVAHRLRMIPTSELDRSLFCLMRLCIYLGNFKVIEQLHSEYAYLIDKDATDPLGNNVLHYALKAKNFRATATLIKQGYQITKEQFNTIGEYVIETVNLELARLLLNSGHKIDDAQYEIIEQALNTQYNQAQKIEDSTQKKDKLQSLNTIFLYVLRSRAGRAAIDKEYNSILCTIALHDSALLLHELHRYNVADYKKTCSPAALELALELTHSNFIEHSFAKDTSKDKSDDDSHTIETEYLDIIMILLNHLTNKVYKTAATDIDIVEHKKALTLHALLALNFAIDKYMSELTSLITHTPIMAHLSRKDIQSLLDKVRGKLEQAKMSLEDSHIVSEASKTELNKFKVKAYTEILNSITSLINCTKHSSTITAKSKHTATPTTPCSSAIRAAALATTNSRHYVPCSGGAGRDARDIPCPYPIDTTAAGRRAPFSRDKHGGKWFFV